VSLFRWTIIPKKELERLRHFEAKAARFWEVHRWFSGWKDLNIIWEYIFNDTYFGGIEEARKKYAEARDTDVYNSPTKGDMGSLSKENARLREALEKISNLSLYQDELNEAVVIARAALEGK
jgi:hypothetical protein